MIRFARIKLHLNRYLTNLTFSGDYEVSASERVAKRKRNSKVPDIPIKGTNYYSDFLL